MGPNTTLTDTFTARAPCGSRRKDSPTTSSNGTNRPAPKSARTSKGRKMATVGRAPRLTHFVAVQCSHLPFVVDKLREVQAAMVAADPSLKACLVDAAKAHFTLAVMSLPTLAEVSLAVGALEGAAAAAGGASFELSVQQLDAFGNRVVFFRPVEDDGLQRLAELAGCVQDQLLHAGLDVRESDRPFTAHLTVAKVRRANGIIGIRPETYASCGASAVTGPIPVSTLQLLEMATVPEGRYYNMVAEVPLQGGANQQDA
mmetsp:Transcript_45019/g.113977  ORF Transcript_45019/g.113977 Transcript_45019/m.113977 type:complete len:258 (+) Transcript_45019:337-1110(+)